MRKLGRSSVLAALVSVLVACGGSGNIGTGGGNPTTPTTPTTPATPGESAVTTLRLTSSAVALPSDADTPAEGLVFTALATDRNNNSVAGATVSFAASSGALIVTNAVTDANGVATATLTTGGDPTLRTINVGASQGTLSGGPIAVQVVAPTSPAVVAPALGNGVGSAFVDQTIRFGQTSLSAGGSTSLRLDLVDRNNGNSALTAQSPSVSFTSPCIAQGRASVNGPATISGGALDATYVASGCSGSDQVTATATLASGSQLTATATLNVQPASLGSIQFESATPQTIGLRGSGQQETSIVVFQVLDASGGPATSGSAVNFTLNTTVGGITLTPMSAQTDAQGFVQTVVNAGTVATAVRVTASTIGSSGQAITSQSEQLVISTGIPDQNSFSLSAESLQIEGLNLDGNTTTLSINAADRFNNPVPDGTAISFTTECGAVSPSCTTTNGACTATFRTQNPRSANNRCTVLATAIGEESYSDSNGNGLFDSGEPFDDLGEAFVDKNENTTRETSGLVATNEEFLDFNNDGSFQSSGSGSFTGILCNSACDTVASSLHVRRSVVVIMASSTATITINPNPIVLPVDGSTTVVVNVTDNAGNCMPTGTTIDVQTTYGSIAAPTTFTQANNTAPGCGAYQFNLQGPAATAPAGRFTVTVTTPTTNTVTVNSVAAGP